jgi:hypothetical protein
LLEALARKLQVERNTTGINAFLGRFGVKHDAVDIVPSKPEYVKRLLKGVSDSLLIQMAAAAGVEVPRTVSEQAHQFRSYLDAGGFQACADDFDRALRNVIGDPDQSIASACSTLESICKSILNGLGRPYPNDKSLRPLVKEVTRALNLSPDQQADAETKRILGGLTNVAAGVAVLRTQFSAAHGRGQGKPRLDSRYARLVVHSAMTIGQFLVETYLGHSKEAAGEV